MPLVDASGGGDGERTVRLCRVFEPPAAAAEVTTSSTLLLFLRLGGVCLESATLGSFTTLLSPPVVDDLDLCFCGVCRDLELPLRIGG